jgi:alcohol dehydrogenase
MKKVRKGGSSAATMKALVFRGRVSLALENRPKPVIADPTDAVVRITTTTICGTDLHILMFQL